MWPFRKKEIIKSKRGYSDYLPVGTIIKIYNDPQEYMIFRYLGNSCISYKPNNKELVKSKIYSKNKEDKNKYYKVDYSITAYPLGVTIYDDYSIMHDDIEEVIHMGYDDSFRREVLKDIDNWNEEGDINE